METENRASERSSSEKWQSSTPVKRSESLLLKLASFYSVMGNRPEEPGALALMTTILTQSATDEQIDGALTRCARECRYPVRLSDILQRIPGLEVPQPEAEARRAFEVLMGFVDKYVGNDVHGTYGPEHGSFPKSFPKLSDRILGTVRRTGGWKVYARKMNEDFPFVQKRFFEEYAAWTAVEQVPVGKFLVETPQLQLVAKPMRLANAEKLPKPAGEQVDVKKIPEPLTEAQIRDRREVLRQQAEFLCKTRATKP